jgi:hypothetical protein
MEVCGIYGYEFTCAFSIDGIEFIPRFTDVAEAQSTARSRTFNLTGWVCTEIFGSVLPFRLAAVLSFIERMKVVISDPVDHSARFRDEFVTDVPGGLFERSSGGGAVLLRDCFNQESRPDFICKALRGFDDERISEKLRFPELIFSCVESFSLSRPLIELQFFLLFSSIEAYARTVLNDDSNRLPRILAKALQQVGFDVVLKDDTCPQKSMIVYTNLRNALFHNGRRYFSDDSKGSVTYYKLSDFLFNWAQLTALLVFKVVDFDDGHINWNSWLDRQAFK